MKLHFVHRLASIALIAALFSSCTDHRLVAPSGQRFRLKRAIITALRFYQSTTYNYNSQGQLTSTVLRTSSSSGIENTPGSGSTTTFTYDGQGRLIQQDSPTFLNPVYTQRTGYKYDSNGKVTSTLNYDNSADPNIFVLRSTSTLDYNSSGTFPIKLTNVSATAPSLTANTQYTFENGNLAKTELNSSTGTNQTVLYTAVNVRNPYYGLVSEFPVSYSNNYVYLGDGPWTYTYDSNGFISRQEQPAGNVPNVRTFEYEAY